MALENQHGHRVDIDAITPESNNKVEQTIFVFFQTIKNPKPDSVL